MVEVKFEKYFYFDTMTLNETFELVIETCFEMLKSSEHEKLWRYSNYKSANLYIFPHNFQIF